MSRSNPPGFLPCKVGKIIGGIMIPNDPRRVGGIYWCSYWDKIYTVLAKDCCGKGSFTVRWEDGQDAHHCTGWDWGKDRIISEPSA